MRKFEQKKTGIKIMLRLTWCLLPLFLATACATADTPDGRSTSIPTITPATDRFQGLNEKQDPVTRVRLGRDVLMPQAIKDDPLPDAVVGPYELRGETLASALQLILDEYDISLAFETDEGLKKKITISNLRGKLSDVVHKVCAVADLYCHYEGGTLTVKKTETFVVDLPPIDTVAAAASAGGGGATSSAAPAAGGAPAAASTAPAAAPAAGGSSGGASGGAESTTNDAYTQIAAGLTAVLAMGGAAGATAEKPTIDTSTRVLIYSATQRSSKAAKEYFERLRKNTALIIFETHIWEVTLDNDNQTGINWTNLAAGAGNFKLTSLLSDTLPAGVGAAVPISITPSYTGGKNFSADFVLDFISEHGSVKTVSQPQITVLSGSKASLAISQQDNYVAGTATTGVGQVGVTPTETLTTGTVNTGLNVNITSAWDQATVYGAINITLNDLVRIDTFTTPGASPTTVQLPHTTSRSLSTEIRVRPGDSVLIGGLVSQTDSVTASGPGFLTPLFTTHRTANKINTELVFLLKPRVVIFTMGDDSDTVHTVDAPRDGILSPDPVAHKVSEVINGSPADSSTPMTPVGKNAVNGKASLPAGISPEAFAPQNTPTPAVPEDMPASLQNQNGPALLSGRSSSGNNKKPNDYGGVNQ